MCYVSSLYAIIMDGYIYFVSGREIQSMPAIRHRKGSGPEENAVGVALATKLQTREQEDSPQSDRSRLGCASLKINKNSL